MRQRFRHESHLSTSLFPLMHLCASWYPSSYICHIISEESGVSQCQWCTADSVCGHVIFWLSSFVCFTESENSLWLIQCLLGLSEVSVFWFHNLRENIFLSILAKKALSFHQIEMNCFRFLRYLVYSQPKRHTNEYQAAVCHFKSPFISLFTFVCLALIRPDS